MSTFYMDDEVYFWDKELICGHIISAYRENSNGEKRMSLEISTRNGVYSSNGKDIFHDKVDAFCYHQLKNISLFD